MSLEQIKMARRFVSGFIYKTDATFNTNCLKLPLSVLVGIDNCGKTFSIAYCYIIVEAAVSFKFVSNQLSNLAFITALKQQSLLETSLKVLELLLIVTNSINSRTGTLNERAKPDLLVVLITRI
jgi:MULE transposase domain